VTSNLAVGTVVLGLVLDETCHVEELECTGCITYTCILSLLQDEKLIKVSDSYS